MLTNYEMISFEVECQKIEGETVEQNELTFSMEYKPFEFQYNEKALVKKTTKPIPEDGKIGLSLGWKFQFPFITDKNRMPETLAQLEDYIEDAIDPIWYHETYGEITRILRGRKLTTLDSITQWLRFSSYRIESFLNLNKDILAFRSDKGAHTVVLNNIDYDTAIEGLLNANTYRILNYDPLMGLEEKYINILKQNHMTKELGRGCYQPHTYSC